MTHGPRAEAAHVAGLDGLRAFAVAAVLAYHLDGSPLPGGFLGVSTFFTLSGFLITTLLLREHERSRHIDLRSFWARRWRRLLPAALACIAAVVVAAAAGAYLDAQVDDLRTSIPWAVAYLANWHQLTVGGGYLAELSAPSVLEHFWSLAIEEQFYIAFPLVVWAVLAAATRRGWSHGLARVGLGALLAVSTAVSVALAVLPGWSPDRVYLGTDTRVAELLLGALLALALPAGLAGPRRLRVRRAVAVLAPLALVVQAVACARVDDRSSWLYEGGLAGFGILSAIVVAGALVPGPLAWLLSLSPLVWIGRISYGLYLVHWPVFQVLTPRRTGLDDVLLTPLRLGVSVAIAALSARLLEEPIRSRPPSRHGLRPALAVSAAAALVIGALALPPEPEVAIAGTDQAGDVLPDAPPPTAPVDQWRVLVVTDERGVGLAEALAAEAEASGMWLVAGVARLDCGPAERAPTCPWEVTLPAAVAQSDADAAVIVADLWDYRPELGAVLPGVSPTSLEGVEWAAARMAQATDLLAGGPDSPRPVMWVSWPVDAEGGSRQELADAAWSVDRRVTMARPALLRGETTAPDPALIAREVGVHAAAAAGAGRRVVVVGDSVAASLAEGLASWGADHGVVVWDNARGGCGVLRSGRRVALDGSMTDESTCIAWRDEWGPAVARWRAETVLVLVGVWDASDRELPGGGEVLAPGDPAWDAYVVSEYVAAIDEIAASGAEAVLVTPPCVGYEGARVPGGVGAGLPVFADDRQAHLARTLLPQVVAQRPATRLFDLFGELCPDGVFAELRIGDELVRPDGLHFGPAGSRWFADTHGADLVG
jgi:peptidoglycan/LPS O-acetylase OafA/YrhL